MVRWIWKVFFSYASIYLFIPKYDLVDIKKESKFQPESKTFWSQLDQKIAKFPTLVQTDQGRAFQDKFPLAQSGSDLAKCDMTL